MSSRALTGDALEPHDIFLDEAPRSWPSATEASLDPPLPHTPLACPAKGKQNPKQLGHQKLTQQQHSFR